jgi:hypothetical protein
MGIIQKKQSLHVSRSLESSGSNESFNFKRISASVSKKEIVVKQIKENKKNYVNVPYAE